MRRVRADTLNRLLSLSGESLVESRWLKPFAESMLRVKRAQRDAARSLDLMYEQFADDLDAGMLASMNECGTCSTTCSVRSPSAWTNSTASSGAAHIAEQLYDEALQCRMRPFGDATRAYPRIVRDLARSLGKQVRFSIVGEGAGRPRHPRPARRAARPPAAQRDRPRCRFAGRAACARQAGRGERDAGGAPQRRLAAVSVIDDDRCGHGRCARPSCASA